MTGSTGYANYYQLVKSSPFEFQELIENFLVTETWFYRNKQALDVVVKKVSEEPSDKIVQILSMACSSGEEPYSIVMNLLDAKIPQRRFCVDAYDLSKKGIAKAIRGLYDKNSFREKDTDFRDRYFTPLEGQFEISKQVRYLVQFHYGNIVDPNCIRTRPAYDVIFCRNVLLYLTNEARKIVFSTIKRSLAEDGILIVTPAETEAARREGFISISEGPSYALKQKMTVAQPPKIKPVSVPQGEPTKDFNEGIEYIKDLADQGEFTKSKKLCLIYIDKHLVDAEGYYLLGLICHARKEIEEAEAAFKKAVYLNPEHSEALFYLSLIEEGKGNLQQANIYRERAVRVEKSNEIR